MKQYNNIKTALVAMAAVALFSACTNEGDNGSEPPLAPGKPASLGVRVEVTPQVRSVVTGTEFTHGSRINIILHDAGSTSKYNGTSMPYEFQKMTAAPGVWIPTATEGLLVSDPAKVYAYAPAQLPAYASFGGDKKSLNVTLPATMDLGAIGGTAFESFYLKLRTTDTNATEIFVCRDEVDLMTGKGTQVSTGAGGTKETAIGMKHALAMVVVNVKRSPGMADNPDVQGIAIRNTAAGAKPLKQGSFALADNKFTPTTTEASYTRTMTGFPINATHYAMLVNPATMDAGDAEMELTTDGTSYTMPMPAKTWESGYVYIYNITISANEAQIGEVLLTDWPAWTEKPFELD